MQRAIGTSIRSAWSKLRRMHVHHQQQQPNQLPNVNAFDPNTVDDLIEDGTSDVVVDEDDEKTEDVHDDKSDNDGNEQDEEDVNHLSIRNEDDEDD